MRIPGLKTARLSKRWLSSRFEKHALILGYHRVADVTEDPFRICVSPKNFAEHLEVLQRLANPVNLMALIQGIHAKQIPERAVALTFDDGYSDLLQTAKPLLKQHGLPATTFVVTGYLGHQFWWDHLERILFAPVSIPERLMIAIHGVTYEWQVNDTNRRANLRTRENSRDQLLLSLYGKLRNAHPEERQRVLAELETWTGQEKFKSMAMPRVLSADEVVQLASGGLVDIGSHSVSHPWLSRLPKSAQSSEIYESKACLENILGRPVISFSYPNGSSSAETAELVRQAGFRCACTSAKDVLRLSSPPYELPRFWMPDWDGAAFERWLWKWL